MQQPDEWFRTGRGRSEGFRNSSFPVFVHSLPIDSVVATGVNGCCCKTSWNQTQKLWMIFVFCIKETNKLGPGWCIRADILYFCYAVLGHSLEAQSYEFNRGSLRGPPSVILDRNTESGATGTFHQPAEQAARRGPAEEEHTHTLVVHNIRNTCSHQVHPKKV